MRLFITLLLLAQFIATWGQKRYDDRNQPFQVIYAEHVENHAGKEISSLQMISIDEVLTLKQGGFLSMIHYFGYPIEFEGDTTIIIKEIQAQFDLLKEGKKKDKYSYLRRPNIEYLFINDGRQGRKEKLSSTGACHDCNFDLEIIYPPKFRAAEVLFSDDLCLTWQSTDSKQYEVELQNVFDENVKTYSCSTNDLRISKHEIEALFEKESKLLVRIKDRATKKESNATFLRKFPSTIIDFPFPCMPEKATYALVAGFYMEMSHLDYNKEAEKYFKLATELPDKQFFKTMLDNFYKRRQ